MQEFESRPSEPQQPREPQSSPENDAATFARLMQEEVFDPINEAPTNLHPYLLTSLPLTRMHDVQMLILRKSFVEGRDKERAEAWAPYQDSLKKLTLAYTMLARPAAQPTYDDLFQKPGAFTDAELRVLSKLTLAMELPFDPERRVYEYPAPAPRPEAIFPPPPTPHQEVSLSQARRDGYAYAAPTQELPGWQERSHDELVAHYRDIIRREYQALGDRAGFFLPAQILLSEIHSKVQSGIWVDATVAEKRQSEFFSTIEYAWDVIAYEAYGRESTERHVAGLQLSSHYKRTGLTALTLSEQQGRILDALAEAADIPHRKGQTIIAVPEQLRGYEDYLQQSEQDRRRL